jgi:hypothetical protein
MSFLPSVVRAEYRDGFRIHLAFNDSSEGTLDFRRWLDGPVFEPLREPNYFRRFFIDGGTLVWPNGADIAPETLYEAVQATRSNPELEPTPSTKVNRRG